MFGQQVHRWCLTTAPIKECFQEKGVTNWISSSCRKWSKMVRTKNRDNCYYHFYLSADVQDKSKQHCRWDSHKIIWPKIDICTNFLPTTSSSNACILFKHYTNRFFKIPLLWVSRMCMVRSSSYLQLYKCNPKSNIN